jgi:hypothetical protein
MKRSPFSRLLNAGLWPFWDFRLALLFDASLLFVGYPLCILVGGLWSGRSDTEPGVSNVIRRPRS